VCHQQACGFRLSLLEAQPSFQLSSPIPACSTSSRLWSMLSMAATYSPFRYCTPHPGLPCPCLVLLRLLSIAHSQIALRMLECWSFCIHLHSILVSCIATCILFVLGTLNADQLHSRQRPVGSNDQAMPCTAQTTAQQSACTEIAAC